VPDYPIPLEDLSTRAPEWQDIEPGYGQWPLIRKVQWDPVHDEIQSSGPTVQIHNPDRPL
jgi:hypothetical protein